MKKIIPFLLLFILFSSKIMVSNCQSVIADWETTETNPTFEGYPTATDPPPGPNNPCMVSNNVANPHSNNDGININTSANVMKVTSVAGSTNEYSYEQAYYNYPDSEYIDFTGATSISIKVYSDVPTTGKVRVILKNKDDTTYTKYVDAYYITTVTETATWKELKFNFYFTNGSSNLYNRISILPDCENNDRSNDWYFDDIKTISLPSAFTAGLIADFNTVTTQRWFDPKSGIKESVTPVQIPQVPAIEFAPDPLNPVTNTSLKITTNSNSYEGALTLLEGKLDFTSKNSISVRVYSTESGRLCMKLSDLTNGLTSINTIAYGYYSTPGQWQLIKFNYFPEITDNNKFNVIGIYPDYEDTTSGVDWYFDDFNFINTPSYTSELIADFGTIYGGFEPKEGAENAPKPLVSSLAADPLNPTTNKTLKITTTADKYEGAATILESKLDFTSKNSISVKVYSSVAGRLTMLISDFKNPTVKIPAYGYYSAIGQWQEVKFNFYTNVPDNNKYDLLAIYPDYEGTTAGNDWYFDDFNFINILPFSNTTIVNFENLNRSFEACNTIPAQVVPNPVGDGINNTTNCLKVTSSSHEAEGIVTIMESKLDFSGKNSISIMYYSPVPNIGVMTIKLQGPGATDVIRKDKYQYTTPGKWQKLVYDLTGTPSNLYNSITLYPGIGVGLPTGIEWYIDQFTFGYEPILPWASDTISTFDEVKRVFLQWGTLGFGEEANPSKTGGINPSDTAMKILTSSYPYEGIKTALDRKLDFTRSKSNILGIKVYSSRSGDVFLKLLNSDDSTNTPVEKRARYTTPNVWQQLTFDLSNSTSNTFDIIAISPDFEGTASNIDWYIDDIIISHPEDLNIYANWDGTNKTFTTMGNALLAAPFANPYKTGINSSDSVMLIETTTQANEGVTTSLGKFIDFSNASSIKLMVYGSNVTGKVSVMLSGTGVTPVASSAQCTVSNTWQLLSFDFSKNNQTDVYNYLTIYPDSGQTREGLWYIDNISGPKLNNTPLELDSIYADWENIFPIVNAFNGLTTSGTATDNPFKAGIDQTDHVLQTTTDISTGEGFYISFPGVFNFNSGRTFALTVRADKAGDVMMQVDGPYGMPIAKVYANYTKPGSWQQLIFTVPDSLPNAYNTIAIFPDLGGTGIDQWYFDNIIGPALIDKLIFLSNADIAEGREDGKEIYVYLVGETLKGSTLTTSNWVVENLPTEVKADSVTKINNISAKITLHGNSTETHTDDIPLTVTVKKAELLSQNKDLTAGGISIVAKGGFSQTRVKKVFAHYLPWFNTSPAIPGVADVRDGWCKEGDCITDLSNIIYSNKPLIGEYNQFDNDVLEYQFLTMYGAGIDGIIININPSIAKDTAITMRCLNMLKIMNETYPNFNMKYIIAYDQKNVLADVYADFKYIRDSLTNNPRFSSFRFNDDKTGYPVIISFAVFNEELFGKCIDSLYNKQAIYFKQNAGNYTACDGSFEWVNYLYTDTINHVYWGEDYFANQEKAMANQHKLSVPANQRNYIMMGAAWPGFNDFNAPWNDGPTRWINRTVDAGETMALTFDRQRHYVPGMSGSVLVELPWIQLVTWNDWSEGTSIEPATLNTYGYKPLKTVQSKIAQFEDKIVRDTMALKLPYEIYQARKSGNNGLALCLLDQFLTGNYTTALGTCNSGYTKFIPVQYRSKEEPNYSGAACSKMVLDYEGTNTITQLAIQTYGVDNSNTHYSGQDFIDPQGIANLMNHFEVDTDYNYAHISRSTRDSAYKDMCYWMSYNIPNVDATKANMPAIVPTGGNFNNWMVVNGFRASANPQLSSYMVNGFYVMDPNINGIGQNMFIQAPTFEDKYFKQITVSGIWKDKYVSVLEPPANNKAIAIRSLQAYKSKPTTNALRFAAAEYGLKNSSLTLNDANIMTAMKNSTRGKVYFVNLAGTKNDYYIVTFEKNGGCVVATIIDANNGALKEVSSVEAPDLNYYSNISKIGTRMKSASESEEVEVYNSFYPSIGQVTTAIDRDQTKESDRGFDFEILPNPASDEIRIFSRSSYQEPITLKIFNVTGELLHELQIVEFRGNESISINLNNYKDGIYFINLVSENNMCTKRLIIKK